MEKITNCFRPTDVLSGWWVFVYDV